MIKKRLFSNLFFGFFLLFLFSVFVSSSGATTTLTMETPTSAKAIAGTFVDLNTTLNADDDWLNCTFYAKSVSTANSSYSIINITYNHTADQTWFNGSFSSYLIEDSDDYSFKAVCYNTSSDSLEVENTGITVDNSVPVISSISPSDNTEDTDGDVTFTATVSGANTTHCSLYYGVKSVAMTHSGDTCSATVTNIPDQIYKWYVTATDGTNTTRSNEYEIRIDDGGNKNGGGTITTPGESSSGKDFWSKAQDLIASYWWILVIIIVIIFLAPIL